MARCNYSFHRTDWNLEYKPTRSSRRWTLKLSRNSNVAISTKTDQSRRKMWPQKHKPVRASQLRPITLPLQDLSDTDSSKNLLRMPPLSLSSSLVEQVSHHPTEMFLWKLAQSCRTLDLRFRSPVLAQSHDSTPLYTQQSVLSAFKGKQPEFLPQNARQDMRTEVPGPSQHPAEFPLVRHKQPGQVCICAKCAVRRSIQLKHDAIQAVGISKIADPNRNLQLRKFPDNKRPYYYFCNFCSNYSSGTLKEMRAHVRINHQDSVRGVTSNGKYYACPFTPCDAKFQKRGPLNKHVKEAH